MSLPLNPVSVCDWTRFPGLMACGGVMARSLHFTSRCSLVLIPFWSTIIIYRMGSERTPENQVTNMVLHNSALADLLRERQVRRTTEPVKETYPPRSSGSMTERVRDRQWRGWETCDGDID